MVKDADNMRGLCVGGDMAILPWNEPNNKITISLPTQPTHLIFGTGIDIVSIFYHTENKVAGLCVGEVSIQPGGLTTHPILLK